MSTIAEISIFPMDKGTSVSPYVARAIKALQSTGLPVASSSMATCVEGTWEQVMAAVDICFKSLEHDCDRIYFTMKVDFRRGREQGMKTKLDSLKLKMSD